MYLNYIKHIPKIYKYVFDSNTLGKTYTNQVDLVYLGYVFGHSS